MKENSIHAADVLYPELSYSIIGAAMDVHNGLGPGWDEWDYHRAMIETLQKRGHVVLSHDRKDLEHRGMVVDHFELDLLIDNMVVLELKYVRSDFHPEHYTQIINYLKIWDKRLGILINYGMERLHYKRVPYDPVSGAVVHVGRWCELSERIPLLCEKVSVAVDEILQQHGSGYGVNVFKKLLAGELVCFGSNIKRPVLSPSYGGLNLGDREIDAILVDSNFLVSVSASGHGASSTELAY